MGRQIYYSGLYGSDVTVSIYAAGKGDKRVNLLGGFDDYIRMTHEQYTGFITREYERLVNEGVIEKPLHFEAEK